MSTIYARTKPRVPRPLTDEEKEGLDFDHRVDVGMAALLNKFGPQTGHAEKQQKEVRSFDPFAERERKGSVNWSKQKQDTSQRRFSGKRPKKQKKDG